MTVVRRRGCRALPARNVERRSAMPADDRVALRRLRPRVRAPRRRLALPDAGARRAAAIRSCSSTAPSASARDAGRSSPEYYQRLPSVARRRSARRRLVDPARELSPPAAPRARRRSRGRLHVLDLGAGSGWLSHRLAALGHHAVAVDALDDEVGRPGRVRATTRSRFRSCRPTSTRCRSRRVSSTSSSSTARCTTRPIPRRRSPSAHRAARAGRCARGDGLADVSRRPRRRGDGRRTRLRRFVRDCGLSEVVMPGRRLSHVRAPRRRSPRSWSCGREFVPSRGPLRLAAAPAAGARAAAARAGRVRRCGWRDDRPLQPAVDDAREAAAAAVADVARRRARGDATTPGRSSTATSWRDPGGGDHRAAAASCRRRRSSLLAVTVMPGPQLTQAVDVCRAVKARAAGRADRVGRLFPDAARRHGAPRRRTSTSSIRSQGERPLLQLVDVLRSGGIARTASAGSSWKGRRAGEVVHDRAQPGAAADPLDDLPDLPYHRVDMERYLHRNYLGRRTVAHNSSFGCPFACSFCAVVAMSNRRWLAQSPARMAHGDAAPRDDAIGVDAVQMHDMDFFISEARTAEFAERIAASGFAWWALGRVDTLMQYSDATWEKMARSGLEDGVLGRRVGHRRRRWRDEQGRQVVGGADARARAPDAPLRRRPGVLVRARLRRPIR